MISNPATDLGSDDVSQTSLTQTGGTVKKNMFVRFGALFGRFQRDRQLFSRLFLSYIIGQPRRPQRNDDLLVFGRKNIG